MRQLAPLAYLQATARDVWTHKQQVEVTRQPDEPMTVQIEYYSRICIHGPMCPQCRREGKPYRVRCSDGGRPFLGDGKVEEVR